MTAVTQSGLRLALERRAQASGYAGVDAALLALPEHDVAVCVVLSDFEVLRYVVDTLAYLRAVPADLLHAWYGCFTKAIFLVGDPSRLTGRHHFARISDDARTAWTLPGPASATNTLRRLLKTLRTDRESSRGRPAALPACVTVRSDPKGQSRMVLRLDIRDLTLEEYLVHLNHLVCEAYIEGHLRDARELVIQHVGELTELPEGCVYQRVQRDPHDEAKLRLFGCWQAQRPSEVF